MSQVEHIPTASVYSNGDFIVIKTCSGYRSYSFDPAVPQQILPMDAPDEDVGLAILHALSKSRQIGKDEVSSFFDVSQVLGHYRKWVASLLEDYGYKSKRALFKNMKNCGVRCVGGNIIFEPMKHVKLEMWEGVTSDGSDYVNIDEGSSPKDVGSAFLVALGRCIA